MGAPAADLFEYPCPLTLSSLIRVPAMFGSSANRIRQLDSRSLAREAS